MSTNPASPTFDQFANLSVLVAGAGVSGIATVRALLSLGADVTIADSREKALEPAVELGARGLLLDPDNSPTSETLDGYQLVVTSPGWKPDSPLLVLAHERGLPVWGDVDFAWRLDQSGILGPPRTWLAITGTNGKTTTTTMLHSVLRAAGLSSAACGNIGLPILDALFTGASEGSGARVDVLAVELSSFQLHWAPSLRPEAGVILNIAEDHLDWHGSMQAYVDAKLQVLTGKVGVLGLDDPVAASLVSRSQAERTVGFRLDSPAENEIGIVDGTVIDRAFGDADGIMPAADIQPNGRPGVLDGLAAAALARAIGVSADAIAEGLRTHETGPHRNAFVAEVRGVRYVDDSKATNPHAAHASLTTYPRVVWVAGGQLKGASVEELVPAVREQLVGAVVIGVDRRQIGDTIARHAPDVPVVEVIAGDDGTVTATLIHNGRRNSALPAHVPPGADSTGGHTPGGNSADDVMRLAVYSAAQLAEPGDTVVLAPSAASLDMFRDYGHRGRSFASAVSALAQLGAHP
ncbi:UDP-N-acetylmuramoylalanine--D-glutamate ligase [Hoyosella rhizosphaerae]|uniref:UDP-N-acetylmuramoylalanine--D-glutamate ligase n=1 Tax=Hoyosella rhizosphaerae TaxID=1755582 RepID=A0A916UFY0_9ACTN|nr:UDP-N-acetylmuramoyl-L-alanine--D-glutamate ligase [Hoyosella rhizosphaerae]GGC70962.1 UDP-N-acetylmuramoylalanine--D-glutamate ligase [Hoyosella rhizosphaerae]